MKQRPEPIAPNDETLYSTTKVAEMFGVTAETVREWIKSGKLDAIQLPGKRYRIRRSVLLAFAQSTYGRDRGSGAEMFV